MVSTPLGFTENSPIQFGQSDPVKQHSKRKLLRQFTETLDIKPKTAFRQLRASKSKRKATISGSMFFSSIPKLISH